METGYKSEKNIIQGSAKKVVGILLGDQSLVTKGEALKENGRAERKRENTIDHNLEAQPVTDESKKASYSIETGLLPKCGNDTLGFGANPKDLDLALYLEPSIIERSILDGHNTPFASDNPTDGHQEIKNAGLVKKAGPDIPTVI